MVVINHNIKDLICLFRPRFRGVWPKRYLAWSPSDSASPRRKSLPVETHGRPKGLPFFLFWCRTQMRDATGTSGTPRYRPTEYLSVFFIFNALMHSRNLYKKYAFYAWQKEQFDSGIQPPNRYFVTRTAAVNTASRYRVFSLTVFRS